MMCGRFVIYNTFSVGMTFSSQGLLAKTPDRIYSGRFKPALHVKSCQLPWATNVLLIFNSNQESPRQTKPKKGPKRKVHEFHPFFREFWCFSLGKQARFTLNFCSGMPLRKVHELTFLWFGLPWPLLIQKGPIL